MRNRDVSIRIAERTIDLREVPLATLLKVRELEAYQQSIMAYHRGTIDWPPSPLYAKVERAIDWILCHHYGV